MNIHHDLETIKLVAIEYAKEHNCNYNIILMNPDEDGKFSFRSGSTYEFVTDSYFEKPRPNVVLLFKTDDLNDKKIQDLIVIGPGYIGSMPYRPNESLDKEIILIDDKKPTKGITGIISKKQFPITKFKPIDFTSRKERRKQKRRK
jgi:hypothetical protein